MGKYFWDDAAIAALQALNEAAAAFARACSAEEPIYWAARAALFEAADAAEDIRRDIAADAARWEELEGHGAGRMASLALSAAAKMETSILEALEDLDIMWRAHYAGRATSISPWKVRLHPHRWTEPE